MARKPIYQSNKRRATFSLTPETLEQMNQIAESLSISRSELVEKWTRENSPLYSPQKLSLTKEQYNLLGEFVAG
ncbi:MAG: ribbon-helix-helix domain-containing protein [Okeania sp. SIO3B3]|nr:ribbon-helix-helix domain-containing protein [Okeania sp. SIO3B3]